MRKKNIYLNYIMFLLLVLGMAGNYSLLFCDNSVLYRVSFAVNTVFLIAAAIHGMSSLAVTAMPKPFFGSKHYLIKNITYYLRRTTGVLFLIFAVLLFAEIDKVKPLEYMVFQIAAAMFLFIHMLLNIKPIILSCGYINIDRSKKLLLLEIMTVFLLYILWSVLFCLKKI